MAPIVITALSKFRKIHRLDSLRSTLIISTAVRSGSKSPHNSTKLLKTLKHKFIKFNRLTKTRNHDLIQLHINKKVRDALHLKINNRKKNYLILINCGENQKMNI